MVTLRKITKDNYGTCFDLKVAEGKKDYVASNVYSLAQAWVYCDTAYPFAIYAGEEMVGFVMMGYMKDEEKYTIWRFMIGERFQAKGYGKAALQLSINYLKDKHGANEIYLSFVPGNDTAEKLYENAGFKRTGEIDDGEIVMRMDLK